MIKKESARFHFRSHVRGLVRLLTLALTAGPLMLTACTAAGPAQPRAVQPSKLNGLARDLVTEIGDRHPLDNRRIQIGPNNFWDAQSRVNLPFSSVLSDTLAAELSGRGAVVTVQEVGDSPLRLVGSYTRAGEDLLVVVRLRQMGASESRDLAVVRGRVDRSSLDPEWLTPRFDRMGRTLVRLLEADYSGMSSLTLITRPFKPGNPAEGDLILGREVETYVTNALAASYTFQNAGSSFSRANAELTGTYQRAGTRMVFHAAVTDRDTGQKLCGASFSVPEGTVPEDLMQPRIQSLDDLAGQAARTLALNYGAGKNAGGKEIGPALVYIGKERFPDTRSGAVVPVSLALAEKIKTALAGYPVFRVTSDPDGAPDLVLSGKVIRGEDGLTLSAALLKIGGKDGGIRFKTLSAAQENLPARYCKDTWFDFDLQGKIDYMLGDLVTDSLGGVSPRPGNPRSEVMIHKFTYRDTRRYSRFSDMLNTRVTDYFSGSMFFMAVKDTEARMEKVKQTAVHLTGVAPKPEAAVAALVSAPYFIRGSFWPTQRGGVDIHASLESVDGRILSSATARIPAYLTDRDLVVPPPETADAPDIAAFSTGGGQNPGIQLMTQKGRHNLSFHRGESIDFFVRSVSDVYLSIFTMDADSRVFRIFPNRFTGSRPRIMTGRIVAIPDRTYDRDFEFRVDGPTGREVVVAFASDRPLPELPGSIDAGAYGMVRYGMNLEEIRSYFARHAVERGARLFWDILPIETLP